MRCIRITHNNTDPYFVAGLGEARAYVRRQHKSRWWDMEIEEVDVITDKANVLHLMNGHSDQNIAREMGFKALRNRSRKSVAFGIYARATNVKKEEAK